MFVDAVASKQVCVSICMTLHYAYLCQTQLITLCVQYRFDDEVKDDPHGPFTPEMIWCHVSVSPCEHCWSIEGRIHSKRRKKLHQKLLEKLVRAHTNLVMKESLDDALHHLLPGDIELIFLYIFCL